MHFEVRHAIYARLSSLKLPFYDIFKATLTQNPHNFITKLKFNAKTNQIQFLSHFRFCVGDKFYLCDNKILCEYDYEERLVFASMANHPMLKKHNTNNISIPGPGQLPPVSSAPTQNGHHHTLLNGLASQRPQTNDLNNNQNGLSVNGSPFGTPTHLKQVITN